MSVELELYQRVTSTNTVYSMNRARWLFLLESYMGGDEYREGAYLTKYALETDDQYKARLLATPLDNHCRSVISVYNSFLFREEPDREFGSMYLNPSLPGFLDDADLEGRSLNDCMKEVATWASVFGHTWLLLSKPNIGARTLADEIASGVRPYLSIITPLTVYDWQFARDVAGRYRLTYFKYVDDVNEQISAIIEWTESEITTSLVDNKNKKVNSVETVPNNLGYIPVICSYNQKSAIRGIGISDITDIADQQRAIYNELSEIEQAQRLAGHPSLVATENTKIGSGAGSIIYMADDIDPGLKPYLLATDGASIDTIWNSIANRIESIDKMANTGAVRSSTASTLSGVAMETEFQLLNARLSAKADSLELTEEQLWKIWANYQATNWDGSIDYPGSFAIHDEQNDFAMLKLAKDTASGPEAIALVDLRIRQLLDDPRLSTEVEEPEEASDYAIEMAVLTAPSVNVADVVPPTPEEL